MEVSELEGGTRSPESHGEQWGPGKLEVETSPCRSDEAFPPGPQDPPILTEPVAAISHGKGLQVTSLSPPIGVSVSLLGSFRKGNPHCNVDLAS